LNAAHLEAYGEDIARDVTQNTAARAAERVHLRSTLPVYSCVLSRAALVRDTAESQERAVPMDSPRRAADVFRALIGDSPVEIFAVAAIDARSCLIGVSQVSVGTISASLVHPREVFKPAILLNAAAVIVAHNHPSGNTTPSPEDRDATRRLVRAGELMGVPVLDHVIIGGALGFFSFKENGMLA
jgi:DNA repair protein RadC